MKILYVNKRHIILMLLPAILLIGSLYAYEMPDNLKTVSKVPTDQKVVALTIDDGPHYKMTPEILKILRDKNVKVTFFVLGVNAEQSPKLLEQEVADGHEIAMHTYSHPSLKSASSQTVMEEFDKAEKVITPIAPKPTLFRPPGGLYNSKVIETANQRGYKVVLWSIDPRDWSRPPSEQVVDTVLKEIKPGSIVLLHDGQYPLPTPEALSIIIDRLRQQGYEFVTVSELLRYGEVRHSLNMFKNWW